MAKARARGAGGHSREDLLKSYGCRGACSSAGRAPALQVSRINHISAASGVAYTETRGATILSNWTDVGPKRFLRSLGRRRCGGHVASHRGNVQAALEPATPSVNSQATNFSKSCGERALTEENQQVAMKPDELLSSFIHFRSHFAAIHRN